MQVDDVNAIYTYMKAQVPKTTEAANIRTQFINWADQASFWDKTMDSDWYDEARSRRNQFNLANATTPAQKAQVQNVLATGITTEQMQGKSRPTINVKTGMVGSQNKSPTVPGMIQLKRLLKLGVSGDDVKAWQSFLGLTPPTGYFDKPTDAKTREYQTLHGLKVDGIVGPKTWADAFSSKTSTSMPVTADVSTAFKSFVSPPKSAPISSSPISAPKKPAAVPEIAEASIIPGANLVSKLPLWAKIVGGAGMAVGAIFGLKHAHIKL